MIKATQPAAGTAGVRAGALQRWVALLCCVVVAVFVRLFTLARAVLGRVFPSLAETPDLDLAVLASRSRGDKMYSSAVVKPLIESRHREHVQLVFLENVLKSTSDAVIVADLSGKITMFNKGAENIFELEEDLAIGDNLFRLCTDSTPDGPRISMMLIENQRIQNLRAELVGVKGKRTAALLTVNFVEDGAGVPAGIVAVIKDNSELEGLLEKVEKLSLTDAKTGLFNSRYFDQKLPDEYERMMRGHMSEISLVVVDIDHFKRFNDTHGHQTGDNVLMAVAEVLKRTARKIDVPSRFGGEEFMVILPATGREGAYRLAERVREAIAELKVPVAGKKSTVSVTVSVGVTTHRPTDMKSVSLLIEEADKAMYKAKQNGRNRTCAFEPAAP